MKVYNEIINSKNDIRISFIIIFIYLAITGFPSFIQFRPFLGILLPVILFRLYKLGYKIPKSLYGIVVFSISFGLIHYVLDHLTLIGFITFVIEFVTIGFSVLYIGTNLPIIFIKVMKFLACIAIILWACIFFIPGFYSALSIVAMSLPQFMSSSWELNSSNPGYSLYIFFIPAYKSLFMADFYRNSGPFYEPGLFASYLTIALIFNYVNNNRLYCKDNLIFIIAILTTFSSAGYISLLLVFLYSAIFAKNIKVKLLYISSILILWNPIMNLDFMSSKITSNVNSSRLDSESRFGAAIYHYEKVLHSPLVGYCGGKLPITQMDRYLGNNSSERILSPNGVTYAFVFWGIPLGVVLYIFLLKSIGLLIPSNKSNFRKCIIFCIILSAAFAQSITTAPILLSFVLIPIIYKRYEYK